MSKYSKRLVNKICNLIRYDEYSIDSICSLSGISRSTYHEWKNTKSDFSDKIQQAEAERREKYTVEAKKSLLKKIQGYTFTEKKTVSFEGKKTEETVTEKHIPPDTKAIIFTLINTDKENWKNRVNNEVTGKDSKDLTLELDLSKLTTEELKQYANIVSKLSKIAPPLSPLQIQSEINRIDKILDHGKQSENE